MLVIGVAGTELTAQERDWLQHDACAGVILFTRNFASRAQVAELAAAIRAAAPRPQLLCVDQEGGRVQRFREGYSALPSLRRLRPAVCRGPGRRAGAGGGTRLADGQRGARQRRRPEFRAGRRPRAAATSRSATARSREIRRSSPNSPAPTCAACTRPAWPRRSSISRATARCARTRISTTPSTTARSTRCAPPTWSRSSPASRPAPMR